MSDKTVVNAPAGSEFINNGDADVDPHGAPSQFIILRNLELSVNEEILAKGVLKLMKPPSEAAPATKKIQSTTGDASLGARSGSLRRIFVVRDRFTGESWRFGFAEFSAVEVSTLIILLCLCAKSCSERPLESTIRSFQRRHTC